MSLETASLFLEKQIVDLEISQFETITSTFSVFKTLTIFFYITADKCIVDKFDKFDVI